MVTVSVDNDPVSVQLSTSESVSVPSGETWAVTVTGAAGSNRLYAKLNGNDFILAGGDWRRPTVTVDMVLTAGDTVDTGDIGGTVSISGWSL